MFFVAALMTFTNTAQFDRFFVLGQHVKTILTSAIYRKALRISNSARKNRTVGEIVNLMSNDAQKFQELVMFLNMLWSAPISIVLAIYFLYQELGVAVFAGTGSEKFTTSSRGQQAASYFSQSLKDTWFGKFHKNCTKFRFLLIQFMLAENTRIKTAGTLGLKNSQHPTGITWQLHIFAVSKTHMVLTLR